MGFFKALGVALLSGAALSVVANILASDNEEKPNIRNVYLVTSDIQYSGINLSAITTVARELVHKIKQGLIKEDDFTHWSLQVGDGDEAWFFEIMSLNIEKRQELKVRQWSSREKTKIKQKVSLGQTSLSNWRIEEICEGVVENKPIYHLKKNNCQHFVKSAMKQICNVKETISDDDEDAFAMILASFLLYPIVDAAALVALVLDD